MKICVVLCLVLLHIVSFKQCNMVESRAESNLSKFIYDTQVDIELFAFQVRHSFTTVCFLCIWLDVPILGKSLTPTVVFYKK